MPVSLLGLALLFATVRVMLGSPASPEQCDLACRLDTVAFSYSLLPRILMGFLAGGALGLSGVLLQRVLRNPLAEPATLGITAGAQFALALATLHVPVLLVFGREGAALLGGLIAVSLLLALTWRRGLDPIAVVLAGMMISLMSAAATATLIIFNGDYVFSLFVWGGGSLVQQDWYPAQVIAAVFVLTAMASALLLRPLAILGLDDKSARSLGLAVTSMRLGVLGLATLLASIVTAHLGIIAFIGLAGPAFARLGAQRTMGQHIAAALVISAALLSLTDSILALTIGLDYDRVPAGAVTALLGGPLLLWLLPRLSMLQPGEKPTSAAQAAPAIHAPGKILLGLAIGLALICVIGLCVGRGPDGWHFSLGSQLADMLPWRLPRLIAALSAGALLAGAGLILQKLTGNALASPEVLGIGASSGVGLCLLLLVAPFASPPLKLLCASVGAFIGLGVILLLSRRNGFNRERLLLAGVAIGAFASAILSAVIAMGTPVSFQLVVWLSGATNDITLSGALAIAAGVVVLVPPLILVARWLDLLSLGDMTARAAGLSLAPARGVLIVLAALMSALATLTVGPLSFLGLVAPHLARLLGLSRGRGHILASLALGAALLGLSDWLARMLAFPYQLPLGLFASLLSGPYLIWLLCNGRGNSR
ncbi:Fe(3+)-hydroxamate ABC transporter permease FhuB [Roseibium sp. CAU 1637]|uniref:Fe(3+)-hydroxamate ABC transporter permease FhuB n=1 Tax=Roseibium limicola TaxID=2816037 RepID=A0A939ENM9_9HYPH|nr:Fe(3+)-hydroxamate ABC transporter permease FhuB [Roseibium limicola]MBO0344688.1 Fe(3+)-hydroxamate ABC transporter permease FhuB [Roseibium limicola]